MFFRSRLLIAVLIATPLAAPPSAQAGGATRHAPPQRARAHRAQVHHGPLRHGVRRRAHRHPLHLGTAAAGRRSSAISAAAPVPVAGDAGGCAYSDQTASSASVQALRDAVVCLINDERTSRGLPALHTNSRLDNSAQGWSDWMVRNSSFAHVVGSQNPIVRIEAAGYRWSSMGENIATGYPTPRAVVRGWMASTEHCRNILAPQFADVGTGVNADPVAGYASGPATWTQDFGLGSTGRPPASDGRPADGCPYR